MRKKRILYVSGITLMLGSVVGVFMAVKGRDGVVPEAGVVDDTVFFETESLYDDHTFFYTVPLITDAADTGNNGTPHGITDAADSPLPTEEVPDGTGESGNGVTDEPVVPERDADDITHTYSHTQENDTHPEQEVTDKETGMDTMGDTTEETGMESGTETDGDRDTSSGPEEGDDATEGSSETESSVTESDSDDETAHTYAEFTFVKYNIEDMPQDYDWEYYLKDHGYISIGKMSRLILYTSNLVDNLPCTKDIIYIVAPRNCFDSLAEDSLGDDAAFCTAMGLDYQTTLCRGISVLRFRKIQDIVNDVTDLSVYAVYYYSYLNADEISETMRVVSRIAENITGTDYDKIKAAHDIICALTVYDDNEPDRIKAHTPYGALVEGRCVCEGYAKAYKLVMNALGIPCNYVSNSNHAWNEVMLNGKWYVVDVTNDDVNKSYDYFLLGMDTLNESSIYGYNNDGNTSTVEIDGYGITQSPE